MERLIPVGRTFFALALTGLAIEHFIFGQFITGRAPPWPESIPGGHVWAWGTGLILIAICLAILTGRKARPAAILAGLLIFVWAFLRQLPIVVEDSLLGGVWTTTGKALVLSSGMLAMAAVSADGEARRAGLLERPMKAGPAFLTTARFSLGLFLLVTGIQHFLFTTFVASLIPEWFPGDPVLWTYFAGVALISGGIGLLVPITARPAALLSGLMVFSWFWIVHLPRTLVGISDSIAVFEALAVSGLALVLAGALRPTERGGAGR